MKHPETKEEPIPSETGSLASRACPVCGAGGVRTFMEIPRVPVYCNVHWSTPGEAVSAPRGDIQLGFCRQCGHIYNTAFDSGRMDYNHDYENSLHFSPRFQRYVQSLAMRLVEQYDLHGKDIVEIGCGKGDFLELLCEVGKNRGVGFDKSYERRPVNETVADRVRFVEDFYSDRYSDISADLICCRHVLEHVERPQAFLASLRRILKDRYDTTVYFEVPNALYTLRNLGIWDLIYEHCSYFSTSSFSRLFASCGFRVEGMNEAYSGQFLSLEAPPDDDTPRPLDSDSEDIDALERDVSAFRDKYLEKIGYWQRELHRIGEAGQRVVIWGAGSKGVTFLNALQSNGQIKHVVDLNPRKQDKFVAGTGQQIVAPAYLSMYRPDVIILMNPIYQEEVAGCLRGMRLSPTLLTA